MFGIGFPEFLLILAVGIIIIKPEDIPQALNTMGKIFAKFKSTSRDIQKSINDVMQVVELDEITREANKAGDIKIDSEEIEEFEELYRLQEELKAKAVLAEQENYLIEKTNLEKIISKKSPDTDEETFEILENSPNELNVKVDKKILNG